MLRRAGVEDSRDDALAYLDSLSHGLILPDLAEALVDTGPELVDWLESSTPLKLRLVAGFPDYHPEHPGGKPQGGRSLEPELFSFNGLGEWADRIVGVTRPMRVTETPIGGGTGVLDPNVEADRTDRNIEGLGRAMVGVQGCLDQGVSLFCESRACELLLEDGRVTGVRFDGDQNVVASGLGPSSSPRGASSTTLTLSAISCGGPSTIYPAFPLTQEMDCAWRCASAQC
jgi:3-oxosteroid 1-dehydrogenase